MTGGGMSALGASMSLGAFLLAWVAMMAAMMMPGVAPVVALYRRGAQLGRVSPTPLFVLGYLVVWVLPGLPAYAAWRALITPLAEGRTWTAWMLAGTLLAAAVWQLTPAKSACLRQCRSPLSFFMRYGRRLERPLGALRTGIVHGAFCFGCCWALMLVLVAVGSMNLAWMIGIAALIFVEKTVVIGERVARVASAACALAAIALLIRPAAVVAIT
jgi:predicted metal-binding membrane protein